MSIVFKYEKHTFVQHFGETFDSIYIVNLEIPYGLTSEKGQIAMTLDGEILGWRFQDEFADRDFHSICDLDVKYLIESVDDYIGSYFEIKGSTLSKTWEKCYVYKQGNYWTEQDFFSYDSLAEAVASVERKLNVTIWGCETYQT